MQSRRFAISDEIAALLKRCSRCGACLQVCPSFRATADESNAARGRVALAAAFEQGRLEITPGLKQRLASCLGCGACSSICPAEADPARIIQAARESVAAGANEMFARLAARGLASAESHPALARLTSSLARQALSRARPARATPAGLSGAQGDSLVQGDSRKVDDGGIASKLEVGSRVLLYAGCATKMFYPGSIEAGRRVLESAGHVVDLVAEMVCCGRPYDSLGLSREADSRIVHLGSVLEQADSEATIVTLCPSCALTLRSAWQRPGLSERQRQMIEPLSSRVFDVHELPLLANGLNTEQHAFGKVGVTWHAPCHLRWGLRPGFDPRAALSSLNGFSYVESGEGGCCGGAGLFSLSHRELSLQIGYKRVEEIAAAGAGIVATGCPSCRMQLENLFKKGGYQIAVRHTVELFAAHGVRPTAERMEEKCRIT